MKEQPYLVYGSSKDQRGSVTDLDDTYIKYNKYAGKKGSHIRTAPKTLIAALIAIPLCGWLNLIPADLFSQTLMSIILCLAFLAYNRIKVTPEGIKYLGRFIRWEEIKTIGISVTKDGVPHKFYRKAIYISKDKYEMPVELSYERNLAKQALGITSEIEGNVQKVLYENIEPGRLIRASFNRRLIHHIIAYWGTDIKNLNETPGWNNYLKVYNYFHRYKKQPDS